METASDRAYGDWVFIVSDPKLDYTKDEVCPSGRKYSISRTGCWIHIDDTPFILSLERLGCPCYGMGDMMVKPAYHFGNPSEKGMREYPGK
jgi:hypothetical protein